MQKACIQHVKYRLERLVWEFKTTGSAIEDHDTSSHVGVGVAYQGKISARKNPGPKAFREKG
jgi:hypothetical protein